MEEKIIDSLEQKYNESLGTESLLMNVSTAKEFSSKEWQLLLLTLRCQANYFSEQFHILLKKLGRG